MTHPLAGGLWKNRWALKHLKALDKEIKAFYESQPYEFIDTFNPQTGDYRLLAIKVTQPKIEWSLMIGDILQNMRSSLDYLVWQMTVANGHQPPPFPLPKGSEWKQIQFPIFLDQNDFDRQASRYLWGISDKAKRFVKKKQPFDSPNHPLWLLGELSNIDKHRILTITSAYLQGLRIPHPQGTLIASHYLHPLGFLEDKTEIAHVTITPPKPPVNMSRGVSLDLVFGRGMVPAEGENAVRALGQMGMAVEKILEGARPYVRSLITLGGTASHLPPSKGQ